MHFCSVISLSTNKKQANFNVFFFILNQLQEEGMYISNTNHLFSIKVQFGQAVLHMTSVSPLHFTYTQSTFVSLHVTSCDTPKY